MTQHITDEELAELERLAEKAAPKPWFVGAPFVGRPGWSVEGPSRNFDGDFDHEADARFIAAARSALPRLIAEVRELRKRVSP